MKNINSNKKEKSKNYTASANVMPNFDKGIIGFSDNLDKLRFGVVVQAKPYNTLPKELKDVGKIIVSEANLENRYIVTVIGDKIHTVSFNDIESIITKPTRYIEKELVDLRSMTAYYCHERNSFCLRWFKGGDIVADFHSISFDKPLEIDVYDRDFYQHNFKNMLRRFERFLKANVVQLSKLEISEPQNSTDAFKAVFYLIYDYLANRQFYLYDFKSYLKILKN